MASRQPCGNTRATKKGEKGEKKNAEEPMTRASPSCCERMMHLHEHRLLLEEMISLARVAAFDSIVHHNTSESMMTRVLQCLVPQDSIDNVIDGCDDFKV